MCVRWDNISKMESEVSIGSLNLKKKNRELNQTSRFKLVRFWAEQTKSDTFLIWSGLNFRFIGFMWTAYTPKELCLFFFFVKQPKCYLASVLNIYIPFYFTPRGYSRTLSKPAAIDFINKNKKTCQHFTSCLVLHFFFTSI